jgi:hypothetical protein
MFLWSVHYPTNALRDATHITYINCYILRHRGVIFRELLQQCYFRQPAQIRVTKSRMRWAGHVARMGKMRGEYKVLARKPEGKRLLGRQGRRWEYIINHLKTKCRPLYLKAQFVPRCKHFSSRLQKPIFITFRKAKFAACSEIHTKHTNSMRSQCRIV